jgi:uncharacterized transporter YbjL
MVAQSRRSFLKRAAVVTLAPVAGVAAAGETDPVASVERLKAAIDAEAARLAAAGYAGAPSAAAMMKRLIPLLTEA